MSDRTAAVHRETAETAVAVELAIDGSGEADVDTGVGFLDHMLESFATHGLFDLSVTVDGDLEVDEHHTVEDVGIVLGQAFDDALGEKAGINRFADRRVPMDESLATVAVDVGGRALFRFEGRFSQASVGDMTSRLARHFWRSVGTEAGMTCHVTVSGENAHHEIEALFKAFARALDDATRIDDRREAPPTTKGTIE